MDGMDGVDCVDGVDCLAGGDGLDGGDGVEDVGMVGQLSETGRDDGGRRAPRPFEAPTPAVNGG
jgi:hypothetical protein